MTINKLILLILFLVFPLTKSFATGQIPDKLIYNNDTLTLFANPLEQYQNINLLRANLFDGRRVCTSTACWRGYNAEWIIINSQLYLTGIFSCCFEKDNIKADLNKLFGNKCVNGKVKADWFSANIIAPQGKLLYYVHMGYGSLYEKELALKFKKGQLVATKMYDNSKSKQSVYSQDQEKLKEFIYTNINWTSLPSLDDKVIKIHIEFSGNEKGIVDDVKLRKGYNTIFDKEAIRVVKSIPEWDVFYRKGKLERRNRTVLIFFSNENREKYKK